METQTFKIWKTTLKRLRFLYAWTGESMVSIADRLVTQELERVEAAAAGYGESTCENTDSHE